MALFRLLVAAKVADFSYQVLMQEVSVAAQVARKHNCEQKGYIRYNICIEYQA